MSPVGALFAQKKKRHIARGSQAKVTWAQHFRCSEKSSQEIPLQLKRERFLTFLTQASTRATAGTIVLSRPSQLDWQASRSLAFLWRPVMSLSGSGSRQRDEFAMDPVEPLRILASALAFTIKSTDLHNKHESGNMSQEKVNEWPTPAIETIDRDMAEKLQRLSTGRATAEEVSEASGLIRERADFMMPKFFVAPEHARM